ncbi:Ribonuclease VapC [Sphingomonas sp. EC-HK361]|uniref:type II toxin-antitoxin system VapC family toxin n=1 Tax=Sphingomonas sp. EC-HK361 TaxID=2038397 RepID=UPI001252B38E|nr:type II toxin-antitoxin system VapC family toxin [Sphingomonas sp. EC-HK361]VVT13010.1 Ribonuclease VapC [Sphingomonas sp. EC-HK361]
MTYLLDTNACLDFLLGRSASLAGRIERQFGRLAVSIISAAELRVGNKTSEDPERDARRVEQFLASVIVPSFDEAAASAYGRLAKQAGVRRGSFDRLIAAHALAIDATLVTNNERDFADISGLKIENWTR